MTWRDVDAVLVPWPLDQEPPAGINIVQDTSNGIYLCREVDGWVWWEDLADHNNNEVDGEAHRWATAVLNADGDLRVVRPS